ncbi:MAG: hypothetical protein HIU88_10935 [Acidobacteria bacterium]|nr:hypothetical protein [Acidobacteriota bacterium]
MNAVISTTRLHLNRRRETFVVPLSIAGMVAVVSILISLIFWRSGSLPGTPGWVSGSRSNPGIAYALVGFLIYLGVSSVATTFPFALALGATRRAFVGGTFLWNAIAAAYIAALFAILNGLEILTHHWFAGFYIFDIYILGGGDTAKLLLIVFLGVLSCLTLGGVFAAAWERFGVRGPQAIAVALVLALAITAIIVVPDLPAIVAAFQLWWLAVAAAALSLLAALGTWLLLRSAIIR